MPLRVDVTLEQVETAVAWYAQRGMIERYCVDGRCYFQMLTFRHHQGNTSKEAESRFPPPPSDCVFVKRKQGHLMIEKRATLGNSTEL
jgi:hypothetical protein